ncbi:serine/arginine repetitive matrix protein 1 [Triticum aestivum]|uniref:serine/arginine repetitive matrix protein 1 n=1 Tax=Triticum aestivum TaxID=4565 RepID=UPI001D006E07|nr:serine/arginine repetitive matrix protein 1-like [Triticum aestivum]
MSDGPKSGEGRTFDGGSNQSTRRGPKVETGRLETSRRRKASRRPSRPVELLWSRHDEATTPPPPTAGTAAAPGRGPKPEPPAREEAKSGRHATPPQPPCRRRRAHQPPRAAGRPLPLPARAASSRHRANLACHPRRRSNHRTPRHQPRRPKPDRNTGAHHDPVRLRAATPGARAAPRMEGQRRANPSHHGNARAPPPPAPVGLCPSEPRGGGGGGRGGG